MRPVMAHLPLTLLLRQTPRVPGLLLTTTPSLQLEGASSSAGTGVGGWAGAVSTLAGALAAEECNMHILL
jgi:hypothetical protein